MATTAMKASTTTATASRRTRRTSGAWAWHARGVWVERAIRQELRAVMGRWGPVMSYVMVLVDRRPEGCPRRRWQRLQRAKRMGRLA